MQAWTWMSSWVGYWWILPLACGVVMVLMALGAVRGMAMPRFRCMGGGHGHDGDATEDLRREVEELREELTRRGDRW